MRRLTSLAVTLILLISACSGITVDARRGASKTTVPRPIVGSFFRVFGSCDDLLDYYQSHALEMVGPWGLDTGPIYLEGDMVDVAASLDESGGAEQRVTGTNNQVAGVDETDIVKTDGSRIFTVIDGTLQIATMDDTGVELRGRLRFDWPPQSMLLEGDTLLLIGQIWGGGGITPLTDRIAPDYGYGSATRLTRIDVSNPDRPTVTATLDMDGTFVDARLVDGVVRLAVTSHPVGITWAYPDGSGIRAERDATEANKQIIRETTLDNWLPYSVYQADGMERAGRLLDCSNVMAPEEFAGLDTLSLLTFDLREGIDSWSDAAVVASGSTMYATEEHVYLATQRWMNWSLLAETDGIATETEDFRTQIHMFDTTVAGAPRYLASGEVPGFLLNQFSMDEHDGRLRVATTSQPNGWWAGPDSSSQVVVLERRDDRLEEVGSVGGLGRGERIYSVRFIGDTGYVVTFRQTDPLYVIDLSNPTAPKDTGELKINGYSAYLHPIDDGLLLGVGQDGTDEGRVLGTQVSLFDVSDPTDPRRLDAASIDGGWSEVEADHHAFTYVDGLALVPFQSWIWGPGDGVSAEVGRFDTGVMAVRVDGGDLDLIEVLRPVLDGPVEEKDLWQTGRDPWQMIPRRTLVIGDRIFTISSGGIAVHDLATFERLDVETF